MAQDLFGMLDEAEREAAANQNTQPPAIQPAPENPTGQVQASPPGGPAAPQQEFSVLDAMTDFGKGVVAGAEKAVIGTRKTVREVGRAVLPEALQDDAFKAENDSKIEAHADKPETLLGKITSDIVQFGLGFVGGSAILKGAGVATKLPSVVKEIVASGVGTGIVADPNEARLSNIVQEYPFLENPVTEFLAAKPEDGLAEGKFKAALEDMLTTPVAMILFKGVKAIKNQVLPGKAAGQLDGVADDIMKDVESATEQAGKPQEKFAENIIETPKAKPFNPLDHLDEKDAAKYKDLVESQGWEATSDGRREIQALVKKAKDAAKTQGKSAENIIEVPEVKVTAPAEEMVTLYRAESSVKGANIPDYIRDNPDFQKIEKDVRGRWFAEDKSELDFYLKDIGEKAQIKEVQVPKSEYEKYRVSNLVDGAEEGVNPKRHSLRPEKEFFLPRDLADKATVVPPSKPDSIGAGDVGPSPQALQQVEKEVLASNSRGESVFALTKAEKETFHRDLADQIGRGNLDNLFQPVNGAFNYSKMDSPTEVKTTLEFMAETIKPMLDKNVGDVQTFQQIKSLAALVGSKPEQMVANLKTWGVADKQMAATVVAAKNWMQSISTDIYKLSRSVHIDGTGGNSAKVEMVRLIDILADVEGMTKSLQKAAARTTAAGRIRTTAKYSGEDMKKMIDAYGGPDALDKVAERLALTEGDPASIIKTMQASGLRKFIDSHNELWINGVLSGVKTHVINVISATANTLAQPMNMIVGGTLRREWDDVREGMALYRGLRQHIGDSLEMARRAFATERPVLGANHILEHPHSISAANYNLDPNSWLGWGTDAIGKVIRFPGRFLGAEDEFFKQMNYRSKLMAQASREAADMVKNGKLDPKKMVTAADGKSISQVEQYIQDRFQGGFTMQAVPGDKATTLRQTFGTDENALRYAEEATMTQDLKTSTWLGNRSFGETMQTFANTHPVLRGTILPFIRVPVNLSRQAIDYSPLAPTQKRYWAEMAAGGTRRSVAIGKLAMGTNVSIMAGFMAMEGMITGRAPGDKELRDAKLATGWQPYSFVFGDEGNRTYVSFNRLDPIGMVFGLVADFYQMTNHVSESQRNSIGLAIPLALAENLSSKSYLKGVVEIASMMGSGYAKEEIAQRLINMRAASYVPNWVGGFRPDDEMKHVRTMMDAIMAKIPFLSEDVEARRDYLGQKKEYPMQYPWSAVNPFTVSDEKADPVMKELARLSTSDIQAQFTQPREQLGTLDLSMYKLPSGQTAYDRWLEKIGTVTIGGRTFHDKLQDLFKSERYKLANDGTSVYHTGKRVTMIHVEQERYRKEALDAMLKDFQAEARAGRLPYNLYEMAHQDQKNAKRVERNKTPLEILRDVAQ